MLQIHGTAVSVKGRGVLLTGESGRGKSDLALRLIDAGGFLVADDRCDLTIDKGQLIASCPSGIKNLLEVRGIGVLQIEALESVQIDLIIDLCPPSLIERMPGKKTCDEFGVTLPLLSVTPFEASAVAKIHIAVACLAQVMDTGSNS